MQAPILKLKEIIWEITSECHNNCYYCGSKNQCQQQTKPKLIKCIADEIAKCPPEEINISGGDPLLVDLENHKYIKEKLKNTKIKILINPKSLKDTVKDTEIDDDKYDILGLYDAIGISVNTQEELNILKNIYNAVLYKANASKNYTKPPTIITNFNLLNIFMFDQINEFCKKNNNIWQIQFTIYKQEDDKLALYIEDNTLACQYLFDKINDALDNNTKIIIADNMNDGCCSAGINSLGILSDGTIIPCLSMRSWTNDLQPQGNILDPQTHFNEAPNLGVIWQQEFTKQRFCQRECCKEHCNNKIFTRQKSKSQIFIDEIKKIKQNEHNNIDDEDTIIDPPINNFPRKREPWINDPNAMVYAIVDKWPYSTEVYAVQDTWNDE
jgi:MoaA/NifB/PqqE/SkfB family radical SAM enzyme